MRYRFAVSVLALAASVASAQDQPRWRFGVNVGAPATVLEVNSNTAPDSNNSNVSLGIGFGAEASRLWWKSPKGGASVYLRASMAKANAEIGGGSWSPGWAMMGEAGARVHRELSSSFGVQLGAGLSHWRGPDDMAPFANLGAVLVAAEAGVTLRLAQRLKADVTANATRIGADSERETSAGFVWRFLVGVHRER